MRVMRAVQSEFGIEHCIVISGHHEHRKDAVCVYLTPKDVDTNALDKTIRQHLHDYLVPIEIITLDSLPQDPGSLPLPDLKGLLTEYVEPSSTTQAIVQDIWTSVLGGEPLSVHADFFEHGGSSLLAGRLIAKVRKALGVPMTAASIFQYRTIATLAGCADQMGAKCPANYQPLNKGRDMAAEQDVRDGCEVNEQDDDNLQDKRWGRQTRVWVQFIQLLPICLVYPLRRIFTWLLFVCLWLFMQVRFQMPRLEALVFALFLERIISEFILPMFGIAIKWFVIGKYRAGSYRLYAVYYLRWWFVDQTLQVLGRGMFRYTQNGLRLYYTLLGADIGPGVTFDQGCRLAEFDLIRIGAGTAIDDVVIRAFCFEGCRMRLKRVEIGRNCVICSKVSIVPGISVPANSCLGPLSSSYNVFPEDVPVSNKKYCSALFQQPPWYMQLPSYSILLFAWLVVQLPILFVLRAMFLRPWYKKHLSDFYDVIEWFVTPERIAYYIALRIVRVTVQPFIRVMCAIIIKRTIIGK